MVLNFPVVLNVLNGYLLSMHVTSLYLKNLRLFEEALFSFDPHFNIIEGPNARGKTTILEAIYFFVAGRSFRTPNITDLIKLDSEGFYIELTFEKHGIEQTLKASCLHNERKIFYNSTSCPSIASLLGVLQGVMITPDDASLVKGAPSVRRNFMDMHISQINPLYIHHLGRYNKAMRYRNALLKENRVDAIETWEHEMSCSAAYITEERLKALEELSKNSAGLYSELSEEEGEFSLRFRSSVLDKSDFSKAYRHLYHKHRKRELELGVTLHGPHKDDLLIQIGDKDTRFYASEGQQRTAVAAIRFAEWHRLKRNSEEEPFIFIDDAGMSLDKVRMNKLMSYLETFSQVFVTTTHVEKLPFLPKGYKRLKI